MSGKRSKEVQQTGEPVAKQFEDTSKQFSEPVNRRTGKNRRFAVKTNSQIRDYTVAPIYMENKEKGAHEWLIGFEQYPDDMGRFTRVLDEALRELNSDYDAKRYNDLILDQPRVQLISPEIFDLWLKNKGKLGGQHKVPRLMNNRDIVEQILQLSQRENYV